MSGWSKSGLLSASPPSWPGRLAWLDPRRATGAILLAMLVSLLLTFGHALAVWRHDVFFDPDDAMRMVEVRDLLAGQGWFDLVAHRLSPEHPFVMHWSRLVDVPLAVSVGLLSHLMPADAAERATRIAEPLTLFAIFLVALLRLVRTVLDPQAQLPAAMLAVASFEILGEFMPGHVHHHGIQLALLMVTVMFLVEGLEPGRAGRAAWAGLFAAVSLGVGLQNLPFVVAEGAVVVMLWTAQGAVRSAAMAAFGLGLAAGALAIFPVDRPPSAYAQPACDAFSVVHLVAAFAVGSAFAALAAATGWLGGTLSRTVAAAAVAVGLMGLVAWLFPACLGDPYVDVDPFLRQEWLSHVAEAMPLASAIRHDPSQFAPLAFSLAFGLAATLAALWSARSVRADRWMTLTSLAVVGCLATLWQVRVAPSAHAMMIPGAVWALLAFGRWLRRIPHMPALFVSVIGGLLVTQAGWSGLSSLVAPTRTGAPADKAGPGLDEDSCFTPASYRTLAGLRPGLVLSNIDNGPTILAATPHSVLAAPYHRDTVGDVTSIQTFEADPREAEALVAGSHARYLVFCRPLTEVHNLALTHPNGLAAALLQGTPPSWLRPIQPDGGPVAVFGIED